MTVPKSGRKNRKRKIYKYSRFEEAINVQAEMETIESNGVLFFKKYPALTTTSCSMYLHNTIWSNDLTLLHVLAGIFLDRLIKVYSDEFPRWDCFFGNGEV